MATLALSLAGQIAGGAIGGPIGATIGRALGALAGSAVDAALFGDKPPPVAGADLRLQGSREGGPVPRLYGWSRLAGNIIWATELEEITPEGAGAKGTAPSDTTEIAASFAVAFCEGEVQRLGRVWADGQLLETEGLTLRFYRGSETQAADSLIEAKQGIDAAPAYRGLCYIVFERLPLAPFGNRIPNISVELCRTVGELEPGIRAITVVPGATEFGYDPVPRLRVIGPGATANENTHLSRELSDWTLSIDELTALCPNLEHVALVVAWFGDDLRCDACTLKPRVEAASRTVQGTNWVVSGVTRAAAQVVSTHEGGPAFGGTPSDGAVLAAIADLKARGLKVTLYPLILMDIPAGNALADPYTVSSGQPAYPWRGRITCNPAPGVPGTPDQTAAAAAQVSAFVGSAAAGSFAPGAGTVAFSGGADWGYRRMLLHYATLAVMAGGVDTILIGSELRGLTTVRGAGNSFPFVSALTALAADVRGVVGAATRITYAADWTEYSGYQPGGGDRFFHLDPLWASSAIDAVGIDNYMPLADWRDGDDHADAALFEGPYNPAYLRANIAGGEGYDWYYASDADRMDGVRSPITDSLHGEPWVWRFKDLKSWWSQMHHERVGGVRSASATGWIPRSKPVWFTELGCGAVDKGANQPNVFSDPKSVESGRPHFSSGMPDSLMQRQVLRTVLGYWTEADDAQNPQSDIYAGRMLDPGRIYLWTWDARPFPAFPTDSATWSDGRNHQTGHWLTGRLGALASDELVRAIAADYGVALGEVEALPPLVLGMVIDGVMTGRDALAPVLAASGLSLRDDPAGLAVGRARTRLTLDIAAEGLVAHDGPRASRRRPDPSDAVGAVALTYPDRERAYLSASVTAMRLDGGALSQESPAMVLESAGARCAAERMLTDAAAQRDLLEFSLPPSAAALEPGDVIALDGQGDGPFEITDIRDGAARRISARAVPPALKAAITSDRPVPGISGPVARAIPLLAVAHLPPDAEDYGPSRLLLAASAQPWPGEVLVTEAASGSAIAHLTRNATLGELAAPLGPGSIFVWDTINEVTVTLYSGHLSSADDGIVLAGGNRLAVETDSGDWEVIGFAGAELIAPATYRLTRLLRGQIGTDAAVGPAAAGRRVMLLDDRVARVPVSVAWLGETLALRAYAGPADAVGTAVAATIGLAPVLPLAPTGLKAERGAGSNDIAFAWTRRSRADGNSWVPDDAPLEFAPEAYRLTIFNGATAVRTIDTVSAGASYTGAQQTADFGSPPASFVFTLAQKSPVLGPGHPAQGEFNA